MIVYTESELVPDYLTTGKKYACTKHPVDENLGIIEDDNGRKIYIQLVGEVHCLHNRDYRAKGCYHLSKDGDIHTKGEWIREKADY